MILKRQDNDAPPLCICVLVNHTTIASLCYIIYCGGCTCTISETIQASDLFRVLTDVFVFVGAVSCILFLELMEAHLSCLLFNSVQDFSSSSCQCLVHVQNLLFLLQYQGTILHK